MQTHGRSAGSNESMEGWPPFWKLCLSDSQWDSRRLDTESWGRGSTTVGPLVRVLIFCLEPVNSSSVKDLRTYIEGPEKKSPNRSTCLLKPHPLPWFIYTALSFMVSWVSRLRLKFVGYKPQRAWFLRFLITNCSFDLLNHVWGKFTIIKPY